MKKSISMLFVLAVFVTACGLNNTQEPTVVSGGETPAIQPTIQEEDSSSAEMNDEPVPAGQTESGNGPDVRVSDMTYQAGYAFKSEAVPGIVRPGPDGTVYLVGFDRQRIYQVKDGLITEYRKFPFNIFTFAFDPSGTLWIFNDETGWLMKEEDGGMVNVVEAHRPFFIFSESGNLYAIRAGEGILKYSTDGQTTVIPTAFGQVNESGWPTPLAVSPDEQISVLDNLGNIYTVNEDGSYELITTIDPGAEASIFYDSKGDLYVYGWTGLFKVDFETGNAQIQEWFAFSGFGNNASIFPGSSEFLTNHINTPVVRGDLGTQEASVAYSPRATTQAMSVNADGKLFVAYGNLAEDKVEIFEVNQEGELIIRAETGPSFPLAMTANDEGLVYVSVIGPGQSTIYSFDPETNEVIPVMTDNFTVRSISYDQLDRSIVYSSDDGIFRFDAVNLEKERLYANEIREAIVHVNNRGEIFVLEPPYSLYKLSEDNNLEEVFISDGSIEMVRISSCSDGLVYLTAGMSGVYFSRNNEPWSITSLLSMEDNGEFNIIAYDAPPDGLSITCNLSNDDIFISTGDGIYHFWK
jgi:hypothetical protein